MVADVDRVEHRAARHANRSPDERDKEDEHDSGVDGGLEILAPDGFGRPRFGSFGIRSLILRLGRRFRRSFQFRFVRF